MQPSNEIDEQGTLECLNRPQALTISATFPQTCNGCSTRSLNRPQALTISATVFDDEMSIEIVLFQSPSGSYH